MKIKAILVLAFFVWAVAAAIAIDAATRDGVSVGPQRDTNGDLSTGFTRGYTLAAPTGPRTESVTATATGYTLAAPTGLRTESVTATATATPTVQPTAVIGSLPITKFPTDVPVIPMVVTDWTSQPCTHFATNKGKAAWPGTQEKPWPLAALLRGSKAAFLKKWSAANHRRSKVCGTQDWPQMQRQERTTPSPAAGATPPS